MGAAVLTIGGVQVTMIEDQFDLTNALDERQRFKCDVIDYTGTLHFQKGEQVVLTDPVLGVLYSGYINSDKEVPQYPSGTILHSIDCIDQHYLADKRTYTRIYDTPQPAGKIAVDQLHDVLLSEGITQNFALRADTTQSDFSQGIINNTVGTLNITDGDLELAPSGSNVIYTENTTAQFGTGTLTNCVTANNQLLPTATNAIKMVATMSLAGTNTTSTVSSVLVWSGAQAVSSSGQTWIEYDMFIDPSSPEAKMAVDILFSDGSSFSVIGAVSGANEDGQFILPDASNDLSGLATTSWYHRKMSISTGTSSGKTVVGIMVVCKGSRVGTYTGYFKNIQLTGTSPATFFSGTLNVSPPQQLQTYGYSSTDVTVVSSYDLYTATAPSYGASVYKTTTSISVSAVNILKSAYISWIALTPAKTQIVISYSLDGGNSYIPCTNNAFLPELPAGTILTGKSIQLQYQFYFLPEALPDTTPILESVTLIVDTSYQSTKNDVTYEAVLQSNWNAGTLTNLVANSNNELTLNGLIRTWDDGSDANQAMYASSIQQQTVNNRSFMLWNIPAGADVEVRSRFDFAGQWQNFIAEIDVQLTPADPVQHGFVYRTTNWQNNSGSAAYYVWITTVLVALGKGTNSNSSSPTTQTVLSSVSATYASGSWHRLRIVVSGNTHKIYVDGILMINTTDSTYSATGYMGVYTTDGGSGASSLYTVLFDNFGITSSLSGTWLSPSQSLTSAGTYGNSIITWRDKSPSYNGLTNTMILVEVTYNGGSTWATCTNGSPLPGLTAGQALSGVNAQFRITLSTSSAGSLPALDNFVVRVLGGYSSSGSRSTQPLGNDTMIRANVGSGFGTGFDGQTYTQQGTGTTNLTSDEAQISNTTGDVHMIYGNRTGTDLEGTTRFNLINSTMIGTMELRYVDVNNFYRLAVSPTAITLIKKSGGTTYTLATVAATTNTNTYYWARFRVVGNGPVLLYGKIWAFGTLEPGVSGGVMNTTSPMWTITASD